MNETVYLSKVPVHSLVSYTARLIDRHPSVVKLHSPTYRHKMVMSLFGELTGEQPRRDANIQFRLESSAEEAPYFLVQSQVYPENLQHVSGAVAKEVGLPHLAEGTAVAFRIAVNAVRRRTVRDATGKRRYEVTSVPLDHEESESTTFSPWLANRLNPVLQEVSVTTHRREVLSDRDKKALQIDTVDGVAVVGDPQALSDAVYRGIGREKAYGCGLLSIRALG